MTYSTGDIIYHEGSLWQLGPWGVSSNPLPGEWLDVNFDGINDNPWDILYSWSDGDYITFTVKKRLHDGDSWIVDMSEVGNCGNTLGNINGDEYVNIPFVVGETVKVIDGPFNSFHAEIENIDEQKKKLKLIVKIFGRKTPLELNFMQVEKV